LRHLAEQVPADAKRGFSTNRTCEIGLSAATGIPFASILYLVEECTRNN
jgi:D-lactate dehydrogenase